MGLIGSLVCIIEQCMIHQVWEWKWSKTTPFPVMSVMNVTTVISNSRGRKKNKTENAVPFHFQFLPNWFQCSTNSISSAYCDPVTVFILDQYPQQSSLASLPGLEYRRIGLSDCFQASLEIQISSPSIMRGGRTNLILLVSLFVFPQRLLKFAIQTCKKKDAIYMKRKPRTMSVATHTHTHTI